MDEGLEVTNSGPTHVRAFSVLKLGCLGVVGIVVFWVLTGWMGAKFPRTVAKGQKSYQYGLNQSFGYSVEHYRWRSNGFKIQIWAGSALQMSFDVPSLELTRVKTRKWLSQDRAILLELEYVYHDSIDEPGELALLYDFERGELHSFDSASAWSVWHPEHRGSRQATREEFDQLVRMLSQTSESSPLPSGSR